MCEACDERQSVATAHDHGKRLQFCAACLSDALAVGWKIGRASWGRMVDF